MAILRKEESREDLRRRLIEEAEEEERRNPLPSFEEVLAEIQPWRPPEGAPDSVTLLRAARNMEGLPARFLTDSELKRCLIDQAEEYLRRRPNPRLGEVLEEIRNDGTPLTDEDRDLET